MSPTPIEPLRLPVSKPLYRRWVLQYATTAGVTVAAMLFLVPVGRYTSPEWAAALAVFQFFAGSLLMLRTIWQARLWCEEWQGRGGALIEPQKASGAFAPAKS